MYEIKNDRLLIEGRPATFRAARDVGGRITPTLIVLHDTAGGLNAEGSVEWLAGNPNKTSAHFVVGRDGAITQLAPADRKCNHAGQSVWKGREFCNGFSIGIEIVNPGKLRDRGAGAVSEDTGKVYDKQRYSIERYASVHHGGEGWWMPYTTAQLEAVEALVEALARAYPSIVDVAGHFQISPGRKVDPTPLMDWQRMREALERARRTVPAPAEHPKGHIYEVQAELHRLGFYTGELDDRMGSRTESAIFAFQRENRLFASGRLDDATLSLLHSGNGKPFPTGHREEVTASALVEKGSQTIPLARDDKVEGGIQAILAGAMAFALSIKSFISEAGFAIGLTVICGVIAYFGIRQLRRGGHLEWLRVSEHASGKK